MNFPLEPGQPADVSGGIVQGRLVSVDRGGDMVKNA